LTGILRLDAVTLAIQILASMAVFTPPVLAPVASRDIGVEAATVGVGTALIYLASSGSALLSGGFILRLGPMRVSQICLGLIGAGIGLMAAGTAAAAAAGTLLIGLGYGAVTPASSAILNQRTPDRWRAFVFSLKQTGVPIGGAITGAIVPWLMAAFGWRAAALGVAIGCVALLAAVQAGREDVDRARQRDAPLRGMRLREPIRLLWSQRPLRDLALASFAYSGMQMCLGSYLVVYLHELAGLSVPAAGAALSAAMAGGVLGRLFWGFAADRFVSPRRLLGGLGVGMSVAAFSLGAIDAGTPLPLVAAAAFAFGGTAVGWNGVYISEVTRIAPAGQAAAVTGVSFALTYLGVFVSPLVVWLAVTLGFSYGAGFAAVGLLTLWRGAVFFARR